MYSTQKFMEILSAYENNSNIHMPTNNSNYAKASETLDPIAYKIYHNYLVHVYRGNNRIFPLGDQARKVYESNNAYTEVLLVYDENAVFQPIKMINYIKREANKYDKNNIVQCINKKLDNGGVILISVSKKHITQLVDESVLCDKFGIKPIQLI